MRKGANMRTSISRGVIVVAILCVALSSAVVVAEDNSAAATNARPAPRADSAPRPSSAGPAAAPAAPSARGKATFYKAAPPRSPAKSARPHPAGQPNPGTRIIPDKPVIQRQPSASTTEAKLMPRDVGRDQPPASVDDRKSTTQDATPDQPAATKVKKGGERSGSWSHSNRSGRSTLDRRSAAQLRDWRGKGDSVVAACTKHNDHRQHHHNRDWWRHHCNVIVLVGWGYWGWDAGWWYPAWGYNPLYSTYAFDEPVYGYQDLPPDQVIANVQGALQDLGYYLDEIDGVLGPTTRAALESYQQDNGLPVTGLIDPETLQLLGFA